MSGLELEGAAGRDARVDRRLADHLDVLRLPLGEVQAAEHFVEQPHRMVRGDALLQRWREQRDLVAIQRSRGPMRREKPPCRCPGFISARCDSKCKG